MGQATCCVQERKNFHDNLSEENQVETNGKQNQIAYDSSYDKKQDQNEMITKGKIDENQLTNETKGKNQENQRKDKKTKAKNNQSKKISNDQYQKTKEMDEKYKQMQQQFQQDYFAQKKQKLKTQNNQNEENQDSDNKLKIRQNQNDLKLKSKQQIKDQEQGLDLIAKEAEKFLEKSEERTSESTKMRILNQNIDYLIQKFEELEKVEDNAPKKQQSNLKKQNESTGARKSSKDKRSEHT